MSIELTTALGNLGLTLPASNTNPLPVLVTALLPQSWSDPTQPLDAREFSTVEFQIVGTPNTAYTPQRSLDGINFVSCNIMDSNLNTVTSITANGIYSVSGNCYVKLTGGSGSTVTVRASN